MHPFMQEASTAEVFAAYVSTALSRKITCAKVYDWKNKNDNCRIRTCAGNAQQISSLSP